MTKYARAYITEGIRLLTRAKDVLGEPDCAPDTRDAICGALDKLLRAMPALEKALFNQGAIKERDQKKQITLMQAKDVDASIRLASETVAAGNLLIQYTNELGRRDISRLPHFIYDLGLIRAHLSTICCDLARLAKDGVALDPAVHKDVTRVCEKAQHFMSVIQAWYDAVGPSDRTILQYRDGIASVLATIRLLFQPTSKVDAN